MHIVSWKDELGQEFGRSITFYQAKKNKDEDDCSRHHVCTKKVDHLSSCTAFTRAAAFSAVFPWWTIRAARGPPGLLRSTHASQRFSDFTWYTGREPSPASSQWLQYSSWRSPQAVSPSSAVLYIALKQVCSKNSSES